MPGTLYLVATPIGNLSDISLRAIKTLEAADIIACEDTRHTQKLLNHLGLKKKLISYHEHNEIARAEEFGGLLLGGKSIALVSDAGTPGICDPAYQIVKKAIEIGAAVNSIPGAAAFVSALICSGLPTDSFYFGGFLPSKKNGRRARYEEVRLAGLLRNPWKPPDGASKGINQDARGNNQGRAKGYLREAASAERRDRIDYRPGRD
jgi:16S rRNA (cytidine1402-2'-O)-methyltransferase